MNLTLLDNKIMQSGIKKCVVAEKLGVTTVALSNKLAGKYNFSLDDAAILTEILGLSAEEAKEIFLKRGTKDV